MALALRDWLTQYDTRRLEDPNYAELACIEGHATHLAEMEQLNTRGFCPKCSQPITEHAHEVYSNFLELWAEEAMIARDYFIRTGKVPPPPARIPIDKSQMQVTQILGMTFLSLPKD